ncbi:MAG: putative membrane protein [Parvicella sp.]|jgi:uncharacterized membrane protein
MANKNSQIHKFLQDVDFVLFMFAVMILGEVLFRYFAKNIGFGGWWLFTAVNLVSWIYIYQSREKPLVRIFSRLKAYNDC